MPFLKEIIGEENFTKLPQDIQNKHEKTNFVDGAEYVPKDRFKQVNDSMNEYKKQVKERDDQIAGIQDKVKDNETLTRELNDMKEANAKNSKDYETNMKKVKFDYAVKDALKSTKAKDAQVVRMLLEDSKIQVAEDGSVIGLKEQLDILQKDKAYLFEPEVNGSGSFETNSNNTGINTDTKPETHIGVRMAKQMTENAKTEELKSFFK